MKTQMLISRASGNYSLSSLIGNSTTQFRSYESSTSSIAQSSASYLEKLVQLRCKSGNLTVDEALDYFNSMIQMRPIPSIWTFNQLLGALSKMNQYSTVISIYKEMMGCDQLRSGVSTLNTVIKCFCYLKKVKLGLSVLAIMIKTGLQPDGYTLRPLLSALCKEGSMFAARELLRELEEKDFPCDEIVYGTVINGFCKAGETSKALELLKRMRNDEKVKPNAHCFSPIIDSLCKEGRIDEALSLFQDMMDSGVLPTVVCFNPLVHALCFSSQWSEAIKLLEKMKDHAASPDVMTYNVLVGALSKEGRMHEALLICKHMIRRDVQPNIVTYSSLLGGLGFPGQWQKAKSFFDEMMRHDIFPDALTLDGLFNAFLDEGVMDKAQKLLQDTIQHGEEPGVNVTAYNILIKGHCSRSEMDKAQEIFEQMTSTGVIPDVISYFTLIEGYIKIERIDVAFRLLRDMIQRGFLPDHTNVMRMILKKICAKRR